MNALYSLSLKFMGMSTMATAEEQLGGPKYVDLWNTIGGFFVNLLPWLGNLLMKLVYVICRFVLNIVDFMQYFCKKLVGLDYWGTNKVSVDTLGESDIIFKFLYNDGVQKVFKYMVGIFVVLLIVFTIIAIVKNEYAYATDEGGKASNDKMGVFKRSMKAVALVVMLPIMIIMGILASNAILTSLVNAFNLNNNLTMGGQVFVASAYDANKFRVYANNGLRMPATNGVTISAKVKDENGNDIGSEVKFVVPSDLTPVTPSKYGTGNVFVGFMFEYAGKNYLYHTAAEGESDKVARSNVVKYYNHYVEFIRGLGGTLINPTTFGETPYIAKTTYAFDCNLNRLEKSNKITQAAYNSWQFNNLLRLEEYTFDQTVSFTIGGFGSLYPSGVKTYKNNAVYGALHDGGTNGLVALPEEYLVMADLIDYLITEAVEISYINIGDPLIDWHYDNGSEGYLSNNYFNKPSSSFMVAYKDTGYVAYNPDVNQHEEQMGAIYIMAYYNPINNSYVPVVNGGKYIDQYGESHIFKSENLQDNYQGLIVARGILESSYQKSAGTPTQIKDVYQTSVTGDDVSLNDPTYAKITFGDDIVVNAAKISGGANGYTLNTFTSVAEFEQKVTEGDVFTNADFEPVGDFYTNSSGASEVEVKSKNTIRNGGADTGLSIYAKVTYDPNTGRTTKFIYDVIQVSVGGQTFCSSTYTARNEGNGIYAVHGPTQWYRFKMTQGAEDFIVNAESSKMTLTKITLTKYNMFAHYQGNALKEFKGKNSSGAFDYGDAAEIEKTEYLVDLSKAEIEREGNGNFSLIVYVEDGADTVLGNFYYNKTSAGDLSGSTEEAKMNDKKLLLANANTFVLGVDTLYSIPVYADSTDAATYFETVGNRIIFERETISTNSKFDFCLNPLNIFNDGPVFRMNLELFNCASESSVTVSSLKLDKGNIFLDYNFKSDPAMSLETFFVPSKINVIVLVFATVLVFIVLGQAVWGLIARIYDITLYFLVMPGVLAAMPLDNSSMYSNWQKKLIQKVLGAYGVMIGLNFFFILIPAIREASQLFTDFDLQTNISQGSWLAGISANAVNNLVYIMFLLVAFTLIKTLPSTIAGLLGAEDSYAKGADVKKSVKSTVDEVGKHVSGKAAIENFENVFGKKGGDGKRHGGLLRSFVPGSAIYDQWKENKKEKENAKAEQEKNAATERARQEAEAKMNQGDQKMDLGDDFANDVAESVTDASGESIASESLEATSNTEHAEYADESAHAQVADRLAEGTGEDKEDSLGAESVDDVGEIDDETSEAADDTNEMDSSISDQIDPDEWTDEQRLAEEQRLESFVDESSLYDQARQELAAAGLSSIDMDDQTLDAKVDEIRNRQNNKPDEFLNDNENLELLGMLADESKTGNDFGDLGKGILDNDEHLAKFNEGIKNNLVDGLNIADSVEYYDELQKDNDASVVDIDKQIADKKAQMTKWIEAGQKSGRAKNEDDYVINNGSKEDLALGLPSRKQVSDARKELKDLEAEKDALVNQSAEAKQKQEALVENWSNRDDYLDNFADNALKDLLQKEEKPQEVKEEVKEEDKEETKEDVKEEDKEETKEEVKEEDKEETKEEESKAKHSDSADESEHAKVADKLADGYVVPFAKTAEELKGGANNASDSNLAKNYASAAKDYAEASRTYADIAGGKVDKWKEKEKTKDEKKLEKLEAQSDKLRQKQEDGKASMFMWTPWGRSKAYKQFNERNKDNITEQIFDDDNEETFNKIVEGHNKGLKAEAMKKAKKEAAKQGISEAQYISEYIRDNTINDKFGDNKTSGLYNEAKKKYKEKLAIAHWNATHADDPTKKITSLDKLHSSKYSKAVMEEFNNKQSQLKSQARAEFINNRIDNKINKMKEKIALKEQGLYEHWAHKGLRLGLGKVFGRKVTDEDRAKWADKKAKAEGKLERATKMAEKLANSSDPKDKAKLAKAEKAIVQAQREIKHRDKQINRNVMGFVPFIAKGVAKDAPKWLGGQVLTLGKKSVKAVHDLNAKRFDKKIADKEKYGYAKETRKQNKEIEKLTNKVNSSRIELNNILSKGGQFKNLKFDGKETDYEFKAKMNQIISRGTAEQKQKLSAYMLANSKKTKAEKNFKVSARESVLQTQYNNSKQRKLIRAKNAEKSVALDKLNKLKASGKLTPTKEKELLKTIAQAEADVKAIGNIPLRFQKARDIAKVVGKMPKKLLNSAKTGLTRASDSIKDFSQTNRGKAVGKGIRIGASVLTGVLAGPLAGVAVLAGNKVASKIIKHNRNLKAARRKMATPEQLDKRDKDIKASIIKGQKDREEKIRGIYETRQAGQDARNLINEKSYVEKVKKSLLKAGLNAEAKKITATTSAEEAKTLVNKAIDKLTNDRTTINKAIKDVMKDKSVGINQATQIMAAKQLQKKNINSQLNALRGVNKVTIDSGNVTITGGAKVVSSGNVKPDSAAVESALRNSLKNDLNKVIKKPIKEALDAGYKPSTAKSAGKAFASTQEYQKILEKLKHDLDGKIKAKTATTAEQAKFTKIDSELSKIKQIEAKYQSKAKKMGKDIAKILRDKRVKFKVPKINDTRNPDPKGK